MTKERKPHNMTSPQRRIGDIYPCFKISPLGWIVNFTAPRTGKLVYRPPIEHPLAWKVGKFSSVWNEQNFKLLTPKQEETYLSATLKQLREAHKQKILDMLDNLRARIESGEVEPESYSANTHCNGEHLRTEHLFITTNEVKKYVKS